jgi:hypothetical protein
MPRSERSIAAKSLACRRPRPRAEVAAFIAVVGVKRADRAPGGGRSGRHTLARPASACGAQGFCRH